MKLEKNIKNISLGKFQSRAKSANSSNQIQPEKNLPRMKSLSL